MEKQDKADVLTLLVFLSLPFLNNMFLAFTGWPTPHFNPPGFNDLIAGLTMTFFSWVAYMSLKYFWNLHVTNGKNRGPFHNQFGTFEESPMVAGLVLSLFASWGIFKTLLVTVMGQLIFFGIGIIVANYMYNNGYVNF